MNEIFNFQNLESLGAILGYSDIVPFLGKEVAVDIEHDIIVIDGQDSLRHGWLSLVGTQQVSLALHAQNTACLELPFLCI